MTGGVVGLLEIMTFMMMGSLMGVGGGNAFVPLIQNNWVATGNLDPALFAWVIALGTLTPGPKVGFTTGIGYYLHGILGAAVATVSVVIPTALSSAAVSLGMERLQPVMKRIALPSAFVMAGLIAGTGWGLAAPFGPNWLEVAVIGAVAYLVGWRGFDPVWVVLLSVGVGVLLAVR